jgi:hypothetical protein
MPRNDEPEMAQAMLREARLQLAETKRTAKGPVQKLVKALLGEA